LKLCKLISDHTLLHPSNHCKRQTACGM
jgi:hypothetical protein